MHCNKVGFLEVSDILTVNFTNQYFKFLFYSVSGISYLLLLNKYIIILKIILFIGKNHCLTVYCMWYTVRQFALFIQVNFFPVKIHYLMSYNFGCVAKGSQFSVHHKLSIFEINYVKKRAFFCLIVYYPPLQSFSNLCIHSLKHYFSETKYYRKTTFIVCVCSRRLWKSIATRASFFVCLNKHGGELVIR